MNVNGTPVNFGFLGVKDANGNQGITITGVTGVLLQSAEHSKVAECEKARDGNGNQVVHAWSDIHDESSLEWIVSGASLAAATTNTTGSLKDPGSFISITGCTSMPSLVNTTWEVQSGVKVSKSNTGFARVTFPIQLLPGITGAAA
jgi:hypothetical protein